MSTRKQISRFVSFLLVVSIVDAQTLENNTNTEEARSVEFPKVHFDKFNITKRPLNLYIIENGKHVKVLGKSLSVSDTIRMPVSQKIIDYHVGRPPFLIKTRGTVLLLHNNTKKGTLF